ncbi:MAG: Zn-ribbon domain-containing OB-fold protein, partial [Acidimicrobiia bacterium]
MTKPRVPAIEGWFTTDDEPVLLASRGATTGSIFFPKSLAFSRNPAAPAEELEETTLGRRGRVWSWTTNHYQPPAPYIAPDPFVPYTVVAAELPDEQMVVLGQLAAGDDPGAL